jgi:uncharacterized protein
MYGKSAMSLSVFCDTSALLKRYIEETGSAKMDQLFQDTDRVVISVITQIEAASALKRLLMQKELSDEGYKTALENILTDCTHFDCINLNGSVIALSLKVMEQQQLRSLDAIQLGSALSVQKEINAFAVCDAKLASAARTYGFDVFNPLTR